MCRSITGPQETAPMRVAWPPALAGVLLAAVLMAPPSVAASSPHIVPGEVIVQFASGTEGHRMVVETGKQATPDLTGFDPVVARLERDAGVPLTAKQLLSGQRLLLGIETNRIVEKALLDLDLTALTHLAIQRLSALSDIASAQPNYRASFRTPEP